MESPVAVSTKRCVRCNWERPIEYFPRHPNTSDGYQVYCCECYKTYQAGYQAARRSLRSNVPDCDCNPPIQSSRSRRGSNNLKSYSAVDGEAHLYILSYDFDPHGEVHGYKIGKSVDVATRKRNLEGQHPFVLIVNAIFPGKADIETAVHRLLDSRRNTKNRAREWFHVTLDEAFAAVERALRERGEQG